MASDWLFQGGCVQEGHQFTIEEPQSFSCKDSYLGKLHAANLGKDYGIYA